MKKAIIPICIVILLLSITLAGCNTMEGVKKDVAGSWDKIKSISFKNGYRDGYAEGSAAINSGLPPSPQNCVEITEDDYCAGYKIGYNDGYNKDPAQIDLG